MTASPAVVPSYPMTLLPGPVRRALVVAAVAGSVFVALLVLVALRWAPLTGLDREVSRSLEATTTRHGTYRELMSWLTDAGAPTSWRVLALLVAGWLALRRRWRGVVTVTAAAAAAGIGGVLIKWSVGRPRPMPTHPIAHFPGSSFPSGHAVNAAAVAVVVTLLLRRYAVPRVARPAGAVLVGLAVLTGWTRLALGAHYLSDVIGAFALGTACAFISLAVMSRSDRDGRRLRPSVPAGWSRSARAAPGRAGPHRRG